MRLIIADDSEVFAQRLIRELSDIDGVDIVAHARTGAEALRAISTLHPEVVILDIQMPDGSGIDVLESLKGEPISPITIVLTSFAFAQYRKKCLRLGASFFFDKSAEFAKVAEVLAQMLRRGSASGEKEAHGGDC